MIKSTSSKPIHGFCGVPFEWSGARKRSKVESRSRVPSAMRFQPSSGCPLEYKKSRRWSTRHSRRVLCVDTTSGKRQAKAKKSKETLVRWIVHRTRVEGVTLFPTWDHMLKGAFDRNVLTVWHIQSLWNGKSKPGLAYKLTSLHCSKKMRRRGLLSCQP
jgi:hypothetical protein